MTRRLILAALAMLAILSLESCGVGRIAGPATTRDNKPAVSQNYQPTASPIDQGGNEQPVAGRH